MNSDDTEYCNAKKVIKVNKEDPPKNSLITKCGNIHIIPRTDTKQIELRIYDTQFDLGILFGCKDGKDIIEALQKAIYEMTGELK